MIVSAETEPYVGLRPYQSEEADQFFGRSRESWELTTLVLSSRLVVVYGSSGLGKTSLLQAGVLAGLSPTMAHVLPVGRLPRVSSPLSFPTPGTNPLVVELLRSWGANPSMAHPEQLTVAGFLRNLPLHLDAYYEPVPVVAVIDQFEEAFEGNPDDPSRRELLDQLAQAMAEVDRLHLVLSMRQDVLGELLPYEPGLSRGDRRRYRVPGLDRDAALEAVTGPLRRTARSFAPGVAESLVDRLRTTTITNLVGEQRTVVANTVEPINLQVVCSSLWQELPDDVVTVTTEHLQDYGDVEDALSRFCVHAVVDVASSEGIDVHVVWAWLEETFVTDLGTRGSAYEGFAWTAGMPNAVARALERHRILRSEERAGSVWFELLHDGLIDPIRRGRRQAEELPEGDRLDARPDVYLLLAERARQSGRLSDAEAYARGAVRASEHDPRTLAEANVFLARLVFDQGHTEEGELHYRRAAELFDIEQNAIGVARVLASLGRHLMEAGRLADAVHLLRSALERVRTDIDVRLDFAQVLTHSGQMQAALGEYTVILSYAPGAIDALIGRAEINAQWGDPAAALQDLDEAVRRQPDLAERDDVVAARSRAIARMERPRAG